MVINIKSGAALLSLAIVANAALLSGCASGPIEVSQSEEYTRDFIKTFGVFNPSHDWNLATQAMVTVTTSAPTDIKVYATVDNTRYLFGTYLNVNGRHTLNVDVPKGTTDLIVRANGRDYKINAGGFVDISSGRAGESTAPPSMSFSMAERAKWKQFSGEGEILSYRTKLPEERTNFSQVTDNFNFSPEHRFIIYPIYYNTRHDNELGIYYRPLDGSDIVRVPIYRAKTNEISGSASGTSSDQILQQCKEGFTYEAIKDGYEDFTTADFDWDSYRLAKAEEMRTSESEFLLWDYALPGQWAAQFGLSDNDLSQVLTDNSLSAGDEKKYPLVRQMQWDKPGNWDNPNESFESQSAYWRSKGIIVDLQPGYTYGFYLYNPDDKYYFYSETMLNEIWSPHNFKARDDMSAADANALKEKYDGQPTPHFGIYQTLGDNGETRLVVGAEDWPQACDGDLNDLVFFVENYDSDDKWPFEITDEDEIISDLYYEWIIACEDLGERDFDFNDVVFGVTNPVTDTSTGTTTVQIKALASGGTLPVYVYYKDNLIAPAGQENAEFHSWFIGNHTSSTVINAQSYRAKGKTVTIEVDSEFTLSCCKRVSGEGDSGNMGGFRVKVEHSSGDVILAATNPNTDSQIGEAPQMICVPGSWCWPKEKVFILNVYGLFKDWCEYPDSHNEWHTARTESGYWERDDIPTQGGGGSSGSGMLVGIEHANPLYANTREFQYAIESESLQTATSVTIRVQTTGVTNYDLCRIDNTKYNTATYTKEFEGDELAALKEDEGFNIIFWDPQDDFSAKIFIEIKIE